MRIGVVLFQYLAGKVGGTGEMIEQALPRISGLLGSEDRLLLFGGSENLRPLRDKLTDSREEFSRVEFIEVPLSGRGRTLLRLSDLVLPKWGTRHLLQQINEFRPDVAWYPQQSMFPVGVRCPAIVTCVDLQHQHLPENFSWAERWARYQKDRQMMLSADRIACISSATREDLLQCHRGDPSKVGVVYLGGGGELKGGEETGVSTGGSAYVYFPANAYPHKNHVRLIRAFREFRQEHPELKLKLVMTGQISPQLKRELECSPMGVEHMGFVSTERKEELFKGCEGVVFPSLFEGFGIPIIEAMRYGKRVLCHRLKVFEELVGDAVTYCDARTEAGIKEGLERWLCGVERPEVDRERYQEIVQSLTWDRFAAEMTDEFRRLGSRG